ncbi:hypothetical protein HS088_TW03G01323 [Tripterygium wilfordii]|uniref:Uncharacterized protein n=1 Tax=Tripterygium wilfordii TaxID=458696 RepID=A0A7J7DX77_TRIWF|nr:uncharacterized protein LOC119995080 [Tripterygium wilfordii]KAF5750982.1 hypothetical protein HS088_TW03G01323 [Tripterygium wilfordii]
MKSVCVSNCINDAGGDPRIPVRATYVNLYKWPESDAEFVRSAVEGRQNPRVVYSISCRQMYLRSYTFSREEETLPDNTQSCCFRSSSVKDKQVIKNKNKKNNKKKKIKANKRKLNYCLALRRALFRVFHNFLSCGASIDVVDQNH